MRDVMRFTVVDDTGKVSFIAPCSTLEALVASCARGPRTLDEMLDYASPYDGSLAEYVRCGLAVFDEHNTPMNHSAILRALEESRPQDVPVFRVVDDRTREASLTPVRAGVILFNLPARRIVQIQNTYREIRRKGRIRVSKGTSSFTEIHRYELPPEWTLVPGT